MPDLGRIDADHATFETNVALTQKHLRMKLVAGKLELAGLGEAMIGTNQELGAVGDDVTVRLAHAPTHVMIASGAIAVSAAVQSAASGKVATGGTENNIALTVAAADGDQILVAPVR